MGFPGVVLILSVMGILAAVLLPGWSDLLLIAVPLALASLILILRAARALKADDRPRVVVDGSNVMYWKDDTPSIDTVREVVRHLEQHGYAPGVMFDANVGHILTGKYRHDDFMAQKLGLSKDAVMVVPKGTPADPHILTAARSLGARIVTNDRFRDWAGDHPEIARPGHLVTGAYHQGKLSLDLEPATQAN